MTGTKGQTTILPKAASLSTQARVVHESGCAVLSNMTGVRASANLTGASDGLVSIAKLFDAVGVLCFKQTCERQLERWPEDFRRKVQVFDSAKINEKLFREGRLPTNHNARVNAAYQDVARHTLGKSANLRHALIFEADWEETGVAGEAARHLDGVTKLLNGNASWSFLRLGYNPLWSDSSGSCRSVCRCRLVQANICTVERREGDSDTPCFVGSMVAFASHRRMLADL